MSSDSVKKRSSSSCARRRSMNMPIWLPTVASIDSSPSSGSRISRLKNSITLSTSPRSKHRETRTRRAALRARRSRRAESSRRARRRESRPARRWPRRGPAGRCRARNVSERLIGVELGKCVQRRGPDLGAAQGVGLAVDRPERAVLPAERLADGLEDLRRRLVDASRRRGARVPRRTRRSVADLTAGRIRVFVLPWPLTESILTLGGLTRGRMHRGEAADRELLRLERLEDAEQLRDR